MIEDNLLKLFNKLNHSQYINSTVNLSSYILINAEISVLSKGLGFCPTPGAPDIGNIIHDLNAFKRTRLQPFSQDPPGNDNQVFPSNISPSNSNHPSIQ